MHYFLKFIFGMKLYMFRTVPLSIIRSFSLFTQQWYMCWQLASRIRNLDALISQIYFWNKTLHVSDSSSSPSSEVFHCTHSSVIRPDPPRKLSAHTHLHCTHSNGICQHTHICTVHTAMVYVSTHTFAVCTVKNSWWWTEELSETCRVLFQKINLRN
jgi:hypothetical protein